MSPNEFIHAVIDQIEDWRELGNLTNCDDNAYLTAISGIVERFQERKEEKNETANLPEV